LVARYSGRAFMTARRPCVACTGLLLRPLVRETGRQPLSELTPGIFPGDTLRLRFREMVGTARSSEQFP
jgi:hypothetical protein